MLRSGGEEGGHGGEPEPARPAARRRDRGAGPGRRQGPDPRAIDRAAGLPEGTAKNYFATRDALLRAAAERCVERQRADLRAAPAEEIQGRDGLAAFLRAHEAAGLPATRRTAATATMCRNTALTYLLTQPADYGLDDLDAFLRDLLHTVYPPRG
ncbi:hypothetical protein ABT158_04235 [Nonomuraea sp. NPDC001636]|uniref:hypothetical protein n=1 Tax=Nonomuraea sp. NPDC001636 TaxID=3154391 RepID=UPI003325EA19